MPAIATTPLLSPQTQDVVRSPPLNASFSGDSDPVANQVRGDLFIEPAAVPNGITAYTVYLANGTRKDEMLPSLKSLQIELQKRCRVM